MKKHIPNLFTLGNLLCGCLACITILSWHHDCVLTRSPFYVPAVFILFGAFLDFFDGFFARLLGVSGELGKQLDSLADMVTFGLAPGLIAFRMLETTVEGKHSWIIILPLCIVLMSAMRLAKFNISTDQSDSFIGVPVPANALFWIGLPFLLDWFEFSNAYLIIGLSLLFSYFLVAKFRLIALKFKTFGWKGNEARWILILLSIATLVILTIITKNMLAALPIIIILYIIISVINNSLSRNEL